MRNTKLLNSFVAFGAICILASCNCKNDLLTDNKAIVQQAFDIMNRQEFDSLSAFIADDYQRHSQATPDVVIKDYDSFIKLIKDWYTSFPDAVQTIHQLTAEGNFVAFRATFEGTHLAPMNGMPATGKRINSEAIGIHRLDKGKIVETWVTWDNVAVLTQLGAFPPPPAEKQ